MNVFNEQIQLARDYIDRLFSDSYPRHINWFNRAHEGTIYHFFHKNYGNVQQPTEETIQTALNFLNESLVLREFEDQDEMIQYRLPDGKVATQIQVFHSDLKLVNIPGVSRIYKYLIFHDNDQTESYVYIIL